MNDVELHRITKTGRQTNGLLESKGSAALRTSKDWQAPISSGGGPSCKGDHSDPTVTAYLNPDPIALLHGKLTAAMNRYEAAAIDLAAVMHQIIPIDPGLVERGRVNTCPTCIACEGAAPSPRRGLCVACYHAWRRAEMPELSTFKRLREEAS